MYSIKLALRSLRKNGIYSIINILGLAVGLATCILIALWVQDELSYDKFNKNIDNLYRLNANVIGDTYWSTTPAPVALFAKAENADIRNICRYGRYSPLFLDYQGAKFYNLEGLAADTTFFDVFTFPLVKGNTTNPFTDELSLVLSETKAKALFGEEDPIGKVLKTSDNILFHVTAIAKDPPENSSIKFDFIVPFDVQQRTFGGNGIWDKINEDWGNYQYRTYILLQAGADSKLVGEDISKMVDRLRQDPSLKYRFILQPMADIHLYAENGEPQGMKQVRLFIFITALILSIACINYVNLATARAVRRSKEIAVRKIMGVGKSTLLAQLMKETLFIFLLAFILSTILNYLLLPFYNQLAGKAISLNFLNPSVWLVYGIMAVGVFVLAGIYPTFLLASFKPLNAFKEQASGKSKKGYLRKILVVVQFVFSFVLIASTIGIGLQLSYIKNKDLGYSKDHILTVRSINMASHYDAVKNELLKNKNVLGVSAASFGDMAFTSMRGGVGWEGMTEEDSKTPFSFGYVRHDFYELMGVDLVSGSYAPVSDSGYWLLVNQTAQQVMNMDDAVGKRFYLNKGNDELIIRGVVKDYNFDRLNELIKPMVVVSTAIDYSASWLYIKAAAGGEQDVISTIESLWKQYNADYEFSYRFLDETFDRMYRSDLRTSKLITIFSVIAILTSCLGLFGLVIYTAETRTREVGIRKTLGATVANIVFMLSGEFIVLVGISILIALPLSYWLLNLMIVEAYAYHINLSWWIFGIAAVVVLALTMLTISGQSAKVARINPVKAIKIE